MTHCGSGAALGADAAFLDAYQGHGALAQRTSTLVGWATIMHGGIIVGADGRRFGNETSGYSEYAAVIAAQPGVGRVDRPRPAHPRRLPGLHRLPADGRRRRTGLGRRRRGAGAGDRSARATRSAEELAATAALAADPASAPDRFGRKDFEAPLQPPYAAVKVVPALFHTQGGLVVDGSARVLREDGTAIEGLYASGGAAAGISGHGAAGYLAGNGLLPALGLAFLAAEDVAGTSATPNDPSTETTPRPPTVEAPA